MPSRSDLFFLQLAWKNRLVDGARARALLGSLERLEAAGHRVTAGEVSVARGALRPRTARALEQLVREYEARRARSPRDPRTWWERAF